MEPRNRFTAVLDSKKNLKLFRNDINKSVLVQRNIAHRNHISISDGLSYIELKSNTMLPVFSQIVGDNECFKVNSNQFEIEAIFLKDNKITDIIYNEITDSYEFDINAYLDQNN